MSNFPFLHPEWPAIHEAAAHAERYAHSDPRTACFYARRALDEVVRWLYTHDPAYRAPYDDNLNTLLTAESFRQNSWLSMQEKAKELP